MIVCGGRRGLLSDPRLGCHSQSGSARLSGCRSFQQGGVSMSADPMPQESCWESLNEPKWFIEEWLEHLNLESRRKQRAALGQYGFRRFIFMRRVLLDLAVWAL